MARKANWKQRATQLAQTHESTGNIDLAEALWWAHEQDGDFISGLIAKDKIKQRRAYYLKSVWERFHGLASKARLSEIGWTRLSRCPKGHERDLVEGPERKARAGRAHTAWDDTKPHTITLRMSKDQHQIFEKALLRFGAERPTKGCGLARKEEALTEALKQSMKVLRFKATDRPSGRAPSKPPRNRKYRV